MPKQNTGFVYRIRCPKPIQKVDSISVLTEYLPAPYTLDDDMMESPRCVYSCFSWACLVVITFFGQRKAWNHIRPQNTFSCLFGAGSLGTRAFSSLIVRQCCLWPCKNRDQCTLAATPFCFRTINHWPSDGVSTDWSDVVIIIPYSGFFMFKQLFLLFCASIVLTPFYSPNRCRT